jgi:hypothetical protein
MPRCSGSNIPEYTWILIFIERTSVSPGIFEPILLSVFVLLETGFYGVRRAGCRGAAVTPNLRLMLAGIISLLYYYSDHPFDSRTNSTCQSWVITGKFNPCMTALVLFLDCRVPLRQASEEPFPRAWLESGPGRAYAKAAGQNRDEGSTTMYLIDDSTECMVSRKA